MSSHNRMTSLRMRDQRTTGAWPGGLWQVATRYDSEIDGHVITLTVVQAVRTIVRCWLCLYVPGIGRSARDQDIVAWHQHALPFVAPIESTASRGVDREDAR